jgi:RHS repeat-associated protein
MKLKLFLLLALLLSLTADAFAQTTSWTSVQPMEVGRISHTMTVLKDGRALVTGGITPQSNADNSSELFSPQTGWTYTAVPMTVGREGHFAVKLADGRVLIGGGTDPSNTPLKSAEIFDPSNGGQFHAVASMNSSHIGPGTVLLNDGRVIVISGLTSGGTVEIYDPVQNTWTPTASLPTERNGFATVLLPDGSVLILGGQTQDGQPGITTVSRYTTVGGWTDMIPLLTPRLGPTASLLPNGLILVAGGVTNPAGGAFPSLMTTEFYNPDPTNNVVNPGVPMTFGRQGHSATSMPNGDVLVAGGTAYGTRPFTFVIQSELYSHVTGMWTNAGATNAGHSGHRAALLLSGQVLITGGVSDPNTGGVGIASAEVWPVGAPPPPGGIAPPGSTNPQQTVSEPISTGNGNYYYSHTDLTIPGRGMPLVFQRSYNSLDQYAGPFGVNWTHSYNVLFIFTPTGAAVRWGDGHGEAYTLSGGSYVAQPGVFSTLVQNGDGTFLLTRKDQTKFLFSVAGALTSIQDKNGNTITLTYGLAGNLTQITDTVGRNLTLTYDASNRITRIADPIGRTVSFQYDANNNLVQATDPSGGITTFTYDTNHRVLSITQPNATTLLQNTYDSSGRVISQAGGRGFSTTLAFGTPGPGTTTITDARGNQTLHTYDSSLRIVGVTDAASGNTSFTYDANNHRTSVTNQNGRTTNFAYDARGNVAGITDALGDATSFTYDAINDLLTATNAKGNTTSFSFDAKGNLTTIRDALGKTTSFTYDGFGELISKTDARGNTTSYAYDAFGDLTRITDALGHSTTLAYDGIGRLTSISDPNGHTAMASYDALSRLVKITDPLGNQTQFSYDAIGNLLRITDANGLTTAYAYDATNNLVSVTDALGHVTTYSYDPINNRSVFTNANRNATNYAYDVLNRLTRIADPLSLVTSYSYDAVGNVVAVNDAKKQTNRFAYDALNRLLTIAYADGNNVAYAYDPDGNRTSMTDSHGTTAYSYDVLDRLTSVTNPGAAVVSFSYDAVGNRGSLTYPDGKTVAYSYDAANRLAGATDWLGRTTTYTYDAGGNLIGTAYPNTASLAFAYDSANRLLKVANSYRGSTGLPLNPVTSFSYVLDSVGNRLQVTDGSGKVTSYGYDQLYELTSVGSGTKVTRFTYDSVGNRLSLTAPGTSMNYSYDAADRLLTAGTSTFTYDANGNQISKTQTATGTTVYGYDAANRLTSATGGAATGIFAYDGDGNRVSQSVGTGTYNYLNDVATALPVVLQESGPDGNISYAYGLGLISETSSAFDFFYQYDGLGSVMGLTNSVGKLAARYLYDAWGQIDLSIPDSLIGTKNKFRFTGEALDSGTQLYYLRARYYDPGIGRFTTRDPLERLTSITLTINSYQYALADPTRYEDPAGLMAIEQNHQVGLENAELTASLASTFSDNFQTIIQSLLKTVCSTILPFCSTAVGLQQVKEGISSIQQTERQQLNSAVNNCVGLFGTLNQTISCVYGQFSIPPADYQTVRMLVIREAEQEHIALQ